VTSRRRFLHAAAVAAAGATGVAAQAPAKVWRVGYLNLRAGPGPADAAFVRGMRELGYVVGRNLVIEYRWAANDFTRMQPLADELARLPVDVFVTAATPGIAAATRAPGRIPVVMCAVSDPVATGYAASLGKPGGRVTGMTLQANDLARKRLQLVREIVPGAARVGVLTLRIPDGAADVNRLPRDALMVEMDDAARRLGVTLVAVEAGDAGELPGAFERLLRAPVQAVFVQANPLTLQYAKRVAELAAAQRLPALYELRSFTEAGGLVAYGPDLVEMYRRAASFVDRVFKGAQPGDLPIEQPEKLELVVNLKAAQALGLAIPQPVLLRADEVIR